MNAQRLDTRYAFPEQPSTEYLSRLEAAGRVLTDSHDYDTAMRILREAITLEPNNPEAFYALGRLHEDRHDDDEAIDYYTEAIRRNPRCDDYLFARGAILFFRYSDINKAVEDLSLAIRLDPKRADAHCVRAAAYIRLGDEVSIQSARDDVSIARSLRPREERITRLLQQLTAAMDARDRQREQRGKE